MNEPERIPLRRRSPKRRPISEDKWRKIEKIVGRPLDNRTRANISIANELFAVFGRTHAKDNTVLRSELLGELKLWLKITKRLAGILKLPPVSLDHKFDRKDAISPFRRFEGEGIKRLGAILDLHLLRLSVRSARATGEYIANRLTENRGSSLANELWAAWVCLVANHLAQAKVTISASSTNKSPPSPFVLVIEALQAHLPLTCRRHTGSIEALTKHIQRVRRVMGKLDNRQLSLILGGWGSNILGSFPGPLSKLSQSDFEELFAGVFEAIDVATSE
ncbi:MAG: hypothetical protein AB7I42_17670 [Bradyrhizobium sp.]|uniref:hypothetical protein n=1 Tax=Bradyrhizobium sp. TaxID=376 RepID=UPI003D09D196